MGSGLSNFFSIPYQVHNQARLAHLESLGLPLANRRVLELGCGPGEHTGFYLQRGCEVVSEDARQDCLDALKERYPGVQTALCDLNDPAALGPLGTFDVIHCYGILYHLEKPSDLIRYMGEACSGLAVVETCVRPDDGEPEGTVDERIEDFTQSSTGRGSRPARAWVFETLGRYFPFVYLTQTQPNHPEFPVNWNALTNAPPLIRAVFVASKQPLDLPSLSPKLLDFQQRLDPAAYIGVLESMLAEHRAILNEREELCRRLHLEAGDLRHQIERNEQLIQRLHLEGADLRQQLEGAAARVQSESAAGLRESDELRQCVVGLERVCALRLTALNEKEAELTKLHAALNQMRTQLELAVEASRQRFWHRLVPVGWLKYLKQKRL